MTSTRYIIDVDTSSEKDQYPVSMFVRKVNIDPAGFVIGSKHGKTHSTVFAKIKELILEDIYKDSDKEGASALKNI